MSSKSRRLPDFESRSVALFATLARGGSRAGADAKPAGAARKAAAPLRRDQPIRHEPSVEPELRHSVDRADRDRDGSISSARFDEALK